MNTDISTNDIRTHTEAMNLIVQELRKLNEAQVQIAETLSQLTEVTRMNVVMEDRPA